jgi:hypothetical protein
MVVLGKIFDTDAQTYITAVEAADGIALEKPVKTAINNFVVGCKADGIWSAIKASCILAGARTLAGALVPLAGTAPTNFNFVSGDYNRKTGLVGNGITKYLNSNAQVNTTCPFNNAHLSVYVTAAATAGVGYIGEDSGPVPNTGEVALYRQATTLAARIQNTTPAFSSHSPTSTGFIGVARANSSSVTIRANATMDTITNGSIGTSSITKKIAVHARDEGGGGATNGRLAFYSIGESLDLALLDTRITTLIDTYNTAIV